MAMRLDEIEITYLQTRSDDELIELWSGSEQIGELSGYELYRKVDQQYNQEAYFYIDMGSVIGYVILEQKQFVNAGQWFLEEIWIKNDNKYRRKGLAKALITYIKDLKTRLILDYRQSPEAFQLIKSMISKGELTARILDLETKNAEDYNQHTQPALFDNIYKTLIVEDYSPRAGMLGQMVTVDYIGQYNL